MGNGLGMDSSLSLVVAAAQLPWVLLALAGVVVAAVRWHRHPLTSLLVVSGLGVQLLVRVSSVVLGRAGVLGGNWWWAAQAFVGTLGSAALLAAVFVERGDGSAGPPKQRW